MIAPRQRDWTREQAKRELARRKLLDYCDRMDPAYISSRHTRYIVDHLEALERGEISRLMIFMPPRHGKTYHASERFPAWFLGRRPNEQVIIASYALERAMDSARKVRNQFVDVDRWPFNVRLASDSKAAGRWHTSEGGVMLAAGVGGAMTGFGAHLLIVDDPVKDRAAAESETIRAATWDWYTDVARTRLMSGGRQLVMMTRWHEDDLAGRILNSVGADDWTVVNLPVYAKEDDPIGRAPGEELWPEGHLPIPSVAKGEISSRSFSALYEGSPQPKEGALFKRAWMQRRYRTLPDLARTVIYVDSAWKEGVSNDYSAIGVWGTDGIDYYLVHAWHGRLEYPDLRPKVVDAYGRFKAQFPGAPPALRVEDAASGTAIIQDLRRSSGIPIVGVPAKGSKVSRAEAITPIFESGKAVLPEAASWLDEWIEEHLQFPGGAHDDQVDTTSGALAYLSSGSTLSWGKVQTRR